MLSARHRLRDSADFAAAARTRRCGNRRLVLHAIQTDVRVGAPPRVGLVVSKRVGIAVTRNLVKRRLRALMAQRIGQVPNGYDLVVRANPAAAEASFDQLGTDLDRLLRQVLSR